MPEKAFSKSLHTEYIAAFAVPVIFIIAAFIFTGIEPFGEYSFFTSDMQRQYFDLTAVFADKLKNGGNPFVSYGAGLGMNLYAWAAYILFSPFNLLFLLFDHKDYSAVYTVIYAAKLGMTGLFAAVYFNNSGLMRMDKRVTVAFSALYSLCMFNMMCCINVMWLDNAALLPLCFLFTEKITEKYNIFYFTPIYFLCVVTNYYLAYITGVMCFIYFIYYCIAAEKALKSALKAFLLLAVSAVIALCMAAFVLVPISSAILQLYVSPFTVSQNSGLIAFAPKEVLHGIFYISKETPDGTVLDIFSGYAPVFFVLTFIFSKAAAKKERIASLCIVLFFILCHIFAPLYKIMHFMRMPSGFDSRFSYGSAFICLVISARLIMKKDKLQRRDTVVSFICFAAGLGVSLINKMSFFYILHFATGALFLAVYTVILIKCRKKNALNIYLGAAVLCEAFLLAAAGLGCMYGNVYTKADNIDYIAKAKKVFKVIEEKDSGFYRAYDANNFNDNSQLSIGYNSICGFSSLINQNAAQFMSLLGVHTISDNKNIMSRDNCIFTDSFFDIKYIAATGNDYKTTDINGNAVYYLTGGRLLSDNYEKIYKENDCEIYRNKTAFPLMFKASEASINCAENFYKENFFTGIFKNHEMLINSVLDGSYTLYSMERFDNCEKLNCELKPYDQMTQALMRTSAADGEIYTDDINKAGVLVYSFNVKEAGEYYTNFYFKNSIEDIAGSAYSIIINGVPYWPDYLRDDIINDLGWFDKGDNINIKIVSLKNGLKMAEPCLLKMDTAAFNDAAAKIQANGLKNIREENDVILAESDFDKDSFVFTTLAFDKGFHVFIDGRETEKILTASALLGYKVPAGRHKIEIKYTSNGFKEGVIISLISMCAYIILVLKSMAAKRGSKLLRAK